MHNVTQFAKRFNLSRSTILYYERVGLLQPDRRDHNGYRWYGERAESRLNTIVGYRELGLSVAKIAILIHQHPSKIHSEILRHHFDQLSSEIKRLRQQQHAVVSLLQQPELLEETKVNKQRWVEIMAAAGLSEENMVNWHRQFEAMEPEEHQQFLESLGIPEDEIKRIRKL